MQDIENLDNTEEEAGSMSIADLYSELLIYSKLIITILAEEEEKLRKGLAVHKSKVTKALKEAGLPADRSVLSFVTLPVPDHPEQTQMHITLEQRPGIKILSIRRPDPDL